MLTTDMKMKNTQHNHWQNRIRHRFLLTFFDPDEKYQEKEINGFHLIKQFNSRYLTWEVAIYTKEAYLKRKVHQNRVSELLVSRRNSSSETK